MTNFELLILFTLIDFSILFLSFKLFGKKGIYIFIVISVIAANIQVNKGVAYDIVGFHIIATLGNVMFGGIFTANDLLNEKYGRQEARKAVLKSIFFDISFMIFMFISTLFTSLNDPFYNDTNKALNLFFSIDGGALKAVIIGNMVYLISQLFDVLIYSKIKSYSSDIKWLWLRNTGSTLISQILDTTLITYGFGFAGVLPLDYAFEIIISTLVIKYTVALINAPLFYILAFTKPREV
ncbi:queuosine precursor transporter [Francisella tularensis]|uniref:queuosine precursor transporter n=1 Tax=Francisella tularensis TaxID=263 RepID=UPI0002E9FFE1|nr:queuosine precursor transporter [Francisella tularensis]MBK2078020.1 queuosine precursor transporter [Francisella tularensis subsp. mediasiatica]MBK2101577.1 queuosine precursor transporter [Francisella tularensis subsp. mediasiatica]MBK2105002.1 queuosine precursor transporter [Francisella tularensis subsp. mediasiatica]MDN9003087.1 queuosine precursor transporter [Francisella tularensis subsp. mediasiatica]MDN9004041.1 queuosine precursor transporter [Francisella tularensis subsp. mediasi